ncbi:MAG: choice-of-anchor Q domain-containing protein, partial [Cyanobacteria bacterium J06642_11]
SLGRIFWTKGIDSVSNNRGFNGGAIYAYSTSKFEIEDSSFEGNTARNKAGGGAIFTDGINPFGPKYPTKGGTLSIRDSEFINNKTDGGGGALFLFGYGKDRTVIENSVFKGNSSSLSSKGIARGGAIQSNMGLTIKNSAFIDNSTEKQGGALWLNSKNPVDIVNSTFSGNRANGDAGGAMFLNTKSVPVNITNSTIAYNSAGRANGALWYSKSHAVKLTNSIVAFNTAQQDTRQNQVGFQAFDGGGNIEFSNDKRSMRVFAGSLVADPKLSPLRSVNNTWVHALESGSPAINSGVKSGAVNDQRNFRRDSRIDIGAFEFGGAQSSGGNDPTPTPTPTPEPNPEPSPEIEADIVGSSRGEKLLGTRNSEVINALAGNDIIKSKAGDDKLYGRLGNDKLLGGAGKDRLFGGEGNDILEGGKGNDILYGEAGKDTIIGVHSSAKTPGKREKDTMIGGGGADTFVLGDASKIYYVDGKSSSSGTSDYALIKDFSLGQGDRIQLFGNARDYSLSSVSNGIGIY